MCSTRWKLPRVIRVMTAMAATAPPGQQVGSRREAGELGREGADVGEQERRHHEGGGPVAAGVAYQRDEALARGDPRSRGDLVEDDQGGGGQRQHPDQRVAVVGAEQRVRRDPGRIVVGEPGEEPRADDRDERGELPRRVATAAPQVLVRAPAREV